MNTCGTNAGSRYTFHYFFNHLSRKHVITATDNQCFKMITIEKTLLTIPGTLTAIMNNLSTAVHIPDDIYVVCSRCNREYVINCNFKTFFFFNSCCFIWCNTKTVQLTFLYFEFYMFIITRKGYKKYCSKGDRVVSVSPRAVSKDRQQINASLFYQVIEKIVFESRGREHFHSLKRLKISGFVFGFPTCVFDYEKLWLLLLRNNMVFRTVSQKIF